MTTLKDLETALLDFITECEQSDGCMYREFCTRFVTPHKDCPNEWMILKSQEVFHANSGTKQVHL